jgi:hypothetical protein
MHAFYSTNFLCLWSIIVSGDALWGASLTNEFPVFRSKYACKPCCTWVCVFLDEGELKDKPEVLRKLVGCVLLFFFRENH